MVELDIVHIQNDFLRYDTFKFVVAKIQLLELTKVSQIGWYITFEIVVTKIHHHCELLEISQGTWYTS